MELGHKLFGHRSTARCRSVTIRDDRTGYRYPAFLCLCAAREMFLEANYAPRPGSTVLILGAGPTGGPAGAMRARVQWRVLLRAEDSAWSFGLGIESTI
jgi:hypothetical protein